MKRLLMILLIILSILFLGLAVNSQMQWIDINLHPLVYIAILSGIIISTVFIVAWKKKDQDDRMDDLVKKTAEALDHIALADTVLSELKYEPILEAMKEDIIKQVECIHKGNKPAFAAMLRSSDDLELMELIITLIDEDNLYPSGNISKICMDRAKLTRPEDEIIRRYESKKES